MTRVVGEIARQAVNEVSAQAVYEDGRLQRFALGQVLRMNLLGTWEKGLARGNSSTVGRGCDSDSGRVFATSKDVGASTAGGRMLLSVVG